VRVAAVDIGSNSTRLLIAEGERELARESVVTRLGEGVDASGRLGEAGMARVLEVLACYRGRCSAAEVGRGAAVMTSAVRDAANGAAFAARVEDALGLPARVLSGDEEARLTYAGATYGRAGAFLVIDVGGGSTELVLGDDFHVSTQIGVVRHGERHLRADPPAATELEALERDVREELARAVPERLRAGGAPAALAVAGTPTQAAAVDLGLERYDPARVEGHTLTAARLRAMRDELAALPLATRREVVGLDPARAPVIVTGLVILLEVMACFGLGSVEASERDLLWGLARSTAGQG
jgi:exopolyphosphatase / guanosine-5'-triphosphate,3'-diphosphate pyrophosphatase